MFLEKQFVRFSFVAAVSILGSFVVDAPAVAAPEIYTVEQRAFFEDRALPVLAQNCVKCHGEKKHKADFRMDTLEGLLEGGFEGPAIIPGKPEESFLIEVLGREHEVKMPPDEEDPLSQDEVDVLTEWVRLGAPWPSDILMPDAPAKAPSDGPVAPPREALALVLAKADAAPIDFNRDVRPILADKCYACHGPDPKVRKFSLRLDDGIRAFEELRSGKKPLVPGDVELSSLIQRVVHADPETRMPPPEAAKHLSQEEADTLTQWIQEGAQWDSHWAWVPPKGAEPPEVKNPSWTQNPIDNFILARLDKEGIEPSPAANRETLIRRVTQDLTGLPPTLEEVGAFLADREPRAYERVVDRLLQSPRYGEHMARYWLDLARYADTNGYHIDNHRFMWPWRNWVINAFNENMPFDKFTVDQLAGDLVPDPTIEQRIATGFNRNHMLNFEGGAFAAEYRAQYVFDRVDTTGTVWLGLSVACGKCHTHKYDPISQKEYYEMYAFFNTIEEVGLDGPFGNAPPKIMAPLPGQQRALNALIAPVEEARHARNKPMPNLDAAQTAWEAGWAAAHGDRWQRITGERSDTESKTQGGEGVLRLESSAPLDSVVAVRMDVVPTSNTAPLTFVRELEVDVVTPTEEGEESVTSVKFVSVNSDQLREELVLDFLGKSNDPLRLVDGNHGSDWKANGVASGLARTVIFIPEEPFDVPEGSRLRVTLNHNARPSDTDVEYLFATTSSDADAFSHAKLGPWHSSGTFGATSGEQAFKKAYAPEQGVDLDAVYADGLRKWSTLSGRNDGKIHPLNDGVHATYMYREIESPTRRVANVSIGTDDAVKIWVDGELVHETNGERAVEANQDSFFVMLKKGTNGLLMKVANYGGDSSFYFRISYEEFGPEPLDISLLLMKSEKERKADNAALLRDFYYRTRGRMAWPTPDDAARIRDYYRDLHSPEWRELDADFVALKQVLDAYEAEVPTTMVMEEMAKPRDTHILIRGQYDQPGEKVEANVPAVFPQLPQDTPANRLGFAQWLVSPDHPLTARVAVNRYWQQYFGTGIVKTAEDFGSQGEWPSHPQLLDWLATEFMESGWDVKGMQRLIVTSAAYRQASHITPELLERDPANRLIARGPRFRLDAEAVRDSALAISGLLYETVGGPSVQPWQPAGLWEDVSFAMGKGTFGDEMYKQSEGTDNYRRSMYTFWKRTSPPPNLSLFDAPEREFCVSRRERTNTPLQALTLLNDPQFVEAARAFAERLMKEGGPTLRDKATYAFQLSTARRPTEREVAILVDAYRAGLEEFKADQNAVDGLLAVGLFEHDPSLDRSELAAWSTVASLLLNLDETISKL